MAPIAKENEVSRIGAETAPRPNAATPASDAAGKPQAVALEVPVTVNGARAVDGSDKREPFSETTKTVLVFGNGAVIRLQSAVAPGQLLFLTNEKTKKEVVCQVVKSKNYRNISGYVEMEFTEPVVGFWGMRFPSDRIAAQPPAGLPHAPQAAKPSAPLSAAPALPKTGAPVQPRPDATANFNALKALVSSPTASDLPRSAESIIAPPMHKTQPLAQISETKPAATAQPPTSKQMPRVSSDPSSEALKLQAARLQEQLSSMQFAEKPSGVTPPGPPTIAKDAQDSAAKVIEFVKPAPPQSTPQFPAAAIEVEGPKSDERSAKPAQLFTNAPENSVLSEAVKIPSWLEPLAGNEASTPEAPRVQEEPRQRQEPVFESHITSEPPADSAPADVETPAPRFGATLLESESSDASAPSRGSNKGILIGAIAAGILVVAAGAAWYARNQNSPVQASAANAITSTAASVQGPAQNPATNLNTQPVNPAVSPAPPASVSSTVHSAAGSAKAVGNTGAGVSVNNAVAKTPQPAPVQAAPQVQVQPPPKKPALGDVRLAKPKLSGKGQAVAANAEEPGISLNSAASTESEALSAGFSSNPKQPVAPAEPLPIGGDVKPAKLLNSVSPIYPALAKSQHVSGDVRVDALIDANGRVTTTKVVSGPTLLHQAAMDALRQWRYQPATLDGKPVPMHLTVTLQFRLQ